MLEIATGESIPRGSVLKTDKIGGSPHPSLPTIARLTS